MQNSSQEPTLKLYTAEISAVWLPTVGRNKLTSHEYKLVKQWYSEGVALPTVLRAIRQVAERGATVYSLGVIRADLVKLQKEQARMQAGSRQAKEPNWKEEWRVDLPLIIEAEPNERRAALFQRLLDDLSGLTYDQAKARYHEAMKAL